VEGDHMHIKDILSNDVGLYFNNNEGENKVNLLKNCWTKKGNNSMTSAIIWKKKKQVAFCLH